MTIRDAINWPLPINDFHREGDDKDEDREQNEQRGDHPHASIVLQQTDVAMMIRNPSEDRASGQ
jgi:hypothetical protein